MSLDFLYYIFCHIWKYITFALKRSSIKFWVRFILILIFSLFSISQAHCKFFPFKDRTLNHVHSSVGYKYTCSSCNITYYGKTSRHFIDRCREHLRVNQKGIDIKGVSFFIRDHTNDTGHSASIDYFCITDNASSELDVLIHESWLFQ